MALAQTPSTPTTPASPTAPAQPQPAAPATYTDAQLRAFAAASDEIDPISRSLQGATPEARTAATAQIRASLTRHNIDSAAYNAIAARAQSDTELAGRIAALRAPQQQTGEATPPASSGEAASSQQSANPPATSNQ